MDHTDFYLSSFDFDLPQSCIAQRPIEPRSASKLMVYFRKTGKVLHKKFSDLPELLNKDDLLIFNNSKVIPCRLSGRKLSGGEVSITFLNLDREFKGVVECFLKASGKRKVGEEFTLPQQKTMKILKIEDKGKVTAEIPFGREEFITYLNQFGNVPIPPYIRKGKSDELDKADYQTVFATSTGSVAAPTASLHFDQDLLRTIERGGVDSVWATLHVGLGTFQSVESEDIRQHSMHRELYQIDISNFEKLNSKKRKIAVGTTALRASESALATFEKEKKWSEDYRETQIYFYPGSAPRFIDGLITNFHLPKSSLLILVSSLIGVEKAKELYQLAICENYRFYSYGDGMLIL